MFKFVEIGFVFFAKIYIFFYKDKGDYWKIFPVIIISTISMINIQLTISFFPTINRYSTLLLPLFLLLLFGFLFNKKEYDWAVRYAISKKQKMIIISVLIIDFGVIAILSVISRNIYIATH